MAKLLTAILILLALTGLPYRAIGGPQGEAATLVFGVVPQQSAGELARAWTPVLTYLGEKAGVGLRFATAKDISTFEQRLATGDYDLAYMNPYHYTVFHDQPGYRPLAKEKNRRLIGIVVVRKDSPFRDIAELKGRTVAFPGPAAFAATLLPQAQLSRMDVPVKAKYVASHDSVYLAVARGIYVAGGGIPRTFENIGAETRDQLRVLWRTEEYTPHVFAVHPRVSSGTAERLRAALLGMAGDPAGAALLKGLGFNGLETAQDADYDAIRRLDFRMADSPASR